MAREYRVHRYDDKRGNRIETTTSNPLADFRRPRSEHDGLLDNDLVDVLHHNDDTYRVFWNKTLFSSATAMKKLAQAEQLVGLVYINKYKQPMVVRSEPIGDGTAGFVGYRHDGKAILAGVARIFEDHVEFDSNPVYAGVKFNCLCGAPKKITRPPKPAPKSPTQ